MLETRTQGCRAPADSIETVLPRTQKHGGRMPPRISAVLGLRQQAKRDRTDAATAVPSWLRAGRTPMEALRAEAARVEWLHRDGGGHHRPYPLVITADARVYRRAGPASASDGREHAASGAVLSCWKSPAPSGGTVWNGGDSSRCPVGLRIGRAYSRPCAEPTPGCTVLVLIGGTLPPLAPLVLKRPAAPPRSGAFHRTGPFGRRAHQETASATMASRCPSHRRERRRRCRLRD